MTATPDSRIARDLGAVFDAAEADALRPINVRLHDPLGYYAKRDAAKPIDTSTTAGKVSVMAAYDRGESVQAFHRGGKQWSRPLSRAETGDDPSWDWSVYDYRIAPPPVARTALQLAREYLKTQPHEISGGSADGRILALVEEVDGSQCVFVHHNHPIYTESGSAVAHGRYRLLRDDE